MHEVTRRRLKGVAGGAALGLTALVAAATLTDEGRNAVGRMVRRPPKPDAEAPAFDSLVPEDASGAFDTSPTAPADPVGEALASVGALAARLRTGEGTSIEAVAAVEALREAVLDLARLNPPTGNGRRWRHLKRGGEYDEVGRATLHFVGRAPVEGDRLVVHLNAQGLFATVDDGSKGSDGTLVARPTLQVATRPLQEGDVLVIYRAVEGGEHARRRGEFEDGRFEAVAG